MILQVHVLANRAESDLWVNLEDASSGRVRLRTRWFTFTSDLAAHEARKLEVHGTQAEMVEPNSETAFS